MGGARGGVSVGLKASSRRKTLSLETDEVCLWQGKRELNSVILAWAANSSSYDPGIDFWKSLICPILETRPIHRRTCAPEKAPDSVQDLMSPGPAWGPPFRKAKVEERLKVNRDKVMQVVRERWVIRDPKSA